jgi:hypothetical protein
MSTNGCPDCANQEPPPPPLPPNVGTITCFDGVAGDCCDQHCLAKFSRVAATLGISQILSWIPEFTPSHEQWIYNQHNITQPDREALEKWVAALKNRYGDAGSRILEELARLGVGPMSQHHQNLLVDGFLFGTIDGSAHARLVRHMLFGGGNASTAQTLHDERKLLPDAVKYWREHLNTPTLGEDVAKECLNSVKGGDLWAHHPDKALLIQHFLQRCNE